MPRTHLFTALTCLLCGFYTPAALAQHTGDTAPMSLKTSREMPDKDEKIKALNEIQKYVTQHDGTEKPFENAYWNNHEAGIYVDVVSGEALFSSLDKFDSGTGWPSFSKPLAHSALSTKSDNKSWLPRTEVRSSTADSHLGHVFDDGPKEKGGARYCINSAALRFVPLAEMEKEGYEEYLYLFEQEK